MQVFVAGASGAVGKRLIPMLVKAGHVVSGMTRSAAKCNLIESLGARCFVSDALYRENTVRAVENALAELLVCELTSLPRDLNTRRFDQEFRVTNHLRIEGTDNLLAAGRAAGSRRFAAQNFAGWSLASIGSPIKSRAEVSRNSQRMAA